MHNHKHDKHQKHVKPDHSKHFAHMITNIEKALETNQDLDKFLIEEKTSEDLEVQDHVKAHNRIIDNFKKMKKNIKKEAEHALLEFFKYAFDRSPEDTWKDKMEHKLKKLHLHQLENEARECVIAIKKQNELSSSVKNIFKNMNEKQIAPTIQKLKDQLAFIEKLAEGLAQNPLITRPIDSVIDGALKHNLGYIQSSLQIVSQQFQRLKPYNRNLSIDLLFFRALGPKLCTPINNLIQKVNYSESLNNEQGSKWSSLKNIIRDLANHQIDKHFYFNEDYDIHRDLTRIKEEMVDSCRISFELYKKMALATNQFVKQGNRVDHQKERQRPSLLLPVVLKQIQPFLDFCSKISYLPVIKERIKQHKYASMRSLDYLQLYCQILRDLQFDKPKEKQQDKPNMFQAQLKKLLDFNTPLYNLLIFKKKGYDTLSFDKIYSQSGRMLEQIQRLQDFQTAQLNRQKNQPINQSSKEQFDKKDAEIRNLKISLDKSQDQRKLAVKVLSADIFTYLNKYETEKKLNIQHTKKIDTLQKELQNKSQLLEKANRKIDLLDLELTVSVQRKMKIDQLTKELQSKFEADLKAGVAHKKQIALLTKELQNLQIQNVKVLQELQAQVQIVKQLQDVINTLHNQQQKLMKKSQNFGRVDQSEDERTKQHKALLAFAENLYNELMKKFQMVPYFEKYFQHPKPTKVEECIKQLNRKMHFLLKLLDCYITFAKKSKIWESNAILLEMTTVSFQDYEKKCLQMWKSDLQQCVKTFTNRGAYMHEYQDSVINEF